jgi:hypothetical protein
MADDVQDIYVSTDAGTEWQSLSALAAEQVDAKLPIESVDGTVVVDGAASVFTVSTGGEEHFTLRPDGHIGQGYAGQANINYAIYQGFGISGQEQLGFLAAPKFDGQPAIRCVSVESQPLFTDVVANNVVHFSARDDRGGNKPFAGKQTGFFVGALTKSSTQNIGFDSAVSGVDNFAFLASGTSPSRFNGGIVTASVSGPVGTDASLTLGGQATLTAGDGSEYVPTDSASIATKKIVDDKIWVGTTAQYNAIATKNPTTLYCLTD